MRSKEEFSAACPQMSEKITIVLETKKQKSRRHHLQRHRRCRRRARL